MPPTGMTAFESNGVTFHRWDIFDDYRDDFAAVLTTRRGGYSTGHLQSLNLGHRVNDDPIFLQQNREKVAEALGLSRAGWSMLDQVHGCRIAPAGSDKMGLIGDCDAQILNQTNLIAGVLLADCHPIVIYDPHRKTAAVCHAGWRGTLGGMAKAAVERMLHNGSRRENLIAATGPGIGPCCYEIGADVRDRFTSTAPFGHSVITEHHGAYSLDIARANYLALLDAGLDESRIGTGGFCTACAQDDFYSYRKEKGLTGRHAALVALYH